jgi:MoxR-like ATPase
VLAAKARAVLHGRGVMTNDDIGSVVGPVLRHRVVTNFNAEDDGLKSDDILAQLVRVIPAAGFEPGQGGMPSNGLRSAGTG